MRRMDTADILFRRMVVGYRMTNLKRNEDIRGEPQISDISTIISMSKEMAATYGNNKAESRSFCVNVNRRAEDARDVR
jgi:hypothetical protein